MTIRLNTTDFQRLSFNPVTGANRTAIVSPVPLEWIQFFDIGYTHNFSYTENPANLTPDHVDNNICHAILSAHNLTTENTLAEFCGLIGKDGDHFYLAAQNNGLNVADRSEARKYQYLDFFFNDHDTMQSPGWTLAQKIGNASIVEIALSLKPNATSIPYVSPFDLWLSQQQQAQGNAPTYATPLDKYNDLTPMDTYNAANPTPDTTENDGETDSGSSETSVPVVPQSETSESGE